ncbi:alcohol dehydrogenase catalytic domain-containing protein [Streptomyces scopuliridis]|uniref:alcohol dehydrogenase catalytic domain-containing protein n=1 Tax=Streptomyces scopuliridis TaxID=452529 RepID=UPI00369ED5B5
MPGHEIAGTVAETGSAATAFAVGERVSVGCVFNACGECARCLRGEEQCRARGFVTT